MSFNLLDIAKGYLTEGVVGQLAGNLGEDSSVVTKALGAAAPALMGGVINSASSQGGLSSLMGLLNNSDDSMLDNLGGMLGDSDKSSGLMSAGSGILSSLLGDKLGGIVGAVSSFSGLSSGSTSSIFSFLAPMVMGILGKKVKSDGLGIAGLGDLLTSQKDIVAKALPSGLGSILGMGSLPDLGGAADAMKGAVGSAAGSIKGAASAAIPDVDVDGGGFNWKPIILGLLGLGIAFFAWKQCSKPKIESTTTSTADTSAVSTPMDTSSAVAASDKLTLEGGVELAGLNPEGIENKLVAFIKDASKPVDKTSWFNFDNLNFATGSSNLTAESNKQVENIVAILKAYPKVKLKIGGYTDNVGKPESNIKLSAARATTVMNSIVAAGIDKARLEAEGYGQEHPEASNDTEEGRAKNRRIAVRVTEK
ncbi:MAG: DUF937 domain-containing protein [Leadbetterella sp.]